MMALLRMKRPNESVEEALHVRRDGRYWCSLLRKRTLKLSNRSKMPIYSFLWLQRPFHPNVLTAHKCLRVDR